MARPVAPEAEAAATLRRVLGAVDAGDLEAEGRDALGLVRRMEGAAAAFEVSAQRRRPTP